MAAPATVDEYIAGFPPDVSVVFPHSQDVPYDLIGRVADAIVTLRS